MYHKKKFKQWWECLDTEDRRIYNSILADGLWLPGWLSQKNFEEIKHDVMKSPDPRATRQ
jgi:hypothetical protein